MCSISQFLIVHLQTLKTVKDNLIDRSREMIALVKSI
uniref:Uncharacterized protein n=1 Tax=Arundo donax TaxID=35708 RepID=A0A0A8YLY6_ARUDO